MHDQDESVIPKSASRASLGIAWLAATACLVAWSQTDRTPFLIAGIGFLVVSPIWYLSPPNFRAVFFGPLLGPIMYRRRFSNSEGLLALTGYAMLLTALVMGLHQWWAS